MPEVSLKSCVDRAEGVLIDMHPRITESGCDVILTPNDLLEGKGDFLSPDADGNPPGFKLVSPLPITARNVYAGTSAQDVTKQNTVDIPLHQTSTLLPLLDHGDGPPDQFVESSLPKPLAPILAKVKAEIAGYPATTLERPMWITYSWARSSKHGTLAPPTLIPPLAQGQCIRVKLPDTIPPGVDAIGVWLSTPGTSTATLPLNFKLQKTYPLAFAGKEVELKGPFFYDTTLPQSTDVQSPGAPGISFVSQLRPVQIGSYRFALTAANELGESLPGPVSGFTTVTANPYWGDDNPAGLGAFTISRGALPQGAIGWYLYVLFNGNWFRVYKPETSEGLRKPLSLSLTNILFGGWSGSEFYGKNQTYLMASSEIPIENTTSLELPESALEAPVVFGASRMGAGRIYVKTSELTDEEESPLSDASVLDIADDEILQVIFASRINKLPNATIVEQGADGLPLSYTVSGTGATVSVEDGEVVMKADGSGVFEFATDAIKVDRTKEWGVGVFLEVLDPETGVFTGSFQVILREIGASTTDTVLQTITQIGEYRHHSDIFPSGLASPGSLDLAWKPDTVQVQIVYKLALSKMVVRLSRQLLADYAYTFRRRSDTPNPSAAQTAPPTGTVALEPSPHAIQGPETTAQAAPDRPTYSGEVLLEGDFESAMPAGALSHSLNATLVREAGAALVGSTGLASRKTTGGSSAYAYLDNELPIPTGLAQRNDSAVSTRRKVPTLPSNGSITLQELRSSGGDRYAWVDLDTRNEVSKLSITRAPFSSGDIVTTLDEAGVPTPRTTSLVANQEKSTLSIASIPTANGEVGLTAGGTQINIPVTIGQSAVRAVIQLTITRGCSRAGGVGLYFAEPWPNSQGLGVGLIFARVFAGDTPEVVASRLREYANSAAWQNDYWTVSGSGNIVTLTAKFGAPMFSDYLLFAQQGGIETFVRAQASIITQGRSQTVPDTEESIAARIARTPIPGHNLTQNASAVTIEALEPGAKEDVSFDPRSTGVIGNVVTNTQGFGDSVEEVAEKVVDTYSGNSYVSAASEATDGGAVVTFTHLTSGVKQDATFSPGTTEIGATMTTPIQGSSDIVAYAEDSFGTMRQKRILTGITNTTVFDVDLAASGVGLPPSGDSMAVVQVLASTNGESKTLQAIFEDIDYENVAAGNVAYGVTAESSSSLTWEVYTDLLKVTDRGEDYYRYHNYYGELLNQVHGFLVPGYLPKDGLYIQEGRVAVIPGEEYTVGVFLRFAGVKNPAQPFYLYCVTPDDEIKPLGSLTEILLEDTDLITGELIERAVEQVVGTSEWSEFVGTFTIPSNCYELRIESKKIGEGEIVCQELAIAHGATLERKPLYKTSGSYSATLDLSTPHDPGMFWDRERMILQADGDAPLGTSLDIAYRTATTTSGPYDDPVTDVSLVAQKNVIRVDYAALGDGAATVAIPSGSPHAVYVMSLQDRPISTFLKGDGTELEGGAIFTQRDEFIEPADIVFADLPGGRVSTQVLFAPTGAMPEAEILVYDPETVRYITHRAGLMPFVIETAEQILTVDLKGPVRFSRQAPNRYDSNGRRQAVYSAKLPECWVTEVRDLP